MSGTTLHERLLAVLLKLGCGWVFATALSQLILPVNRLATQLLAQALLILLVLLVLTLLTWTRYQLLILTGVLALSSILIWLTRQRWQENEALLSWLRTQQQRFVWAVDYLLGFTAGSDTQRQWLAQVICILLALLAYLTAVRFARPYIAASTLLVTVLVVQDLAWSLRYGWSLTAALMVLITLARHQKKTWHHLQKQKHVLSARIMLQALPPAALAIILSLMLASAVPATFFHSRHLEGLLDDLPSRIGGMQIQQQNVPDFSLQQAGYYPLTDRLGGPVILSNTPVLQVSGPDDAFLLKGSVRQIYDGRSWMSDPDRSAYRYDSPLWQDEQIAFFDLDMPDFSQVDLAEEQFSRSAVIQWSPVSWPTRTVFTAGKLLRISLVQPDPFQAYFRPSGQLFSKYWLQPGQSIVLDARITRTRQADFAATILQLQDTLASDRLIIPSHVAVRYLQLPSLPEYEADGQLRILASQITADSEHPYAAVMALRNYLMRNNRYNLDVAVPPADADFVSWFLQTGEGYCVYFATALTVMSRLIDIPARYVEGYYVPSSQRAETDRLLTGQHAHAWTEVYLAGIGWIPVDATPGSYNPLPEPSPVITPEQSPVPSLSPPVTPSSLPTVTTAVLPQPEQSSQGPSAVPAAGFLWLLPLLLLTGWMIWFLRTLQQHDDPVYLRRKMPDPAMRVRFFWVRIRDLLQAVGSHYAPGQTPAYFLMAQIDVSGWFTGQEPLVRKVAQALNETFYGPGTPSEETVSALAALLRGLEKTILQRRGRIRWLFIVIRCGFHMLKYGKPDSISAL